MKNSIFNVQYLLMDMMMKSFLTIIFYTDLDEVLDFIENPKWKMGVHEYRDS